MLALSVLVLVLVFGVVEGFGGCDRRGRSVAYPGGPGSEFDNRSTMVVDPRARG